MLPSDLSMTRQTRLIHEDMILRRYVFFFCTATDDCLDPFRFEFSIDSIPPFKHKELRIPLVENSASCIC